MIANRGTLKREQDQIVTDLEAASLFATVPVIAADDGDLETLIAIAQQRITAQGGKIGASVVVWQPTATLTNREAGKTHLGVVYRAWLTIRFRITATEAFLENRDPTSGTGIPALTLAEGIAAALHRPVSAANPIPRYVENITPISQVNDEGEPLTDRAGYIIEVVTEGWATALQTTAVNPGP